MEFFTQSRMCLVVFTLIILFVRSGSQKIASSQMSSLGALRTQWRMTDWVLTGDCSQVSGLTCNPDGTALKLVLKKKFLRSLPAAIGGLTTLDTLDLAYNAIPSIPSEISNLTNLRYLNLGGNWIKGSIPASLFKLEKLYFLNLRTNSFSGSIDSGISAFTNLRTLSLAQNSLSGNLPSSLYSLPLTFLDLSKNRLTGNPDPLWSMNLSTLKLGYNNFYGVLPNVNTSISSLSIQSNKFYGPFPDLFSNITFVNAAENYFTSFPVLKGCNPNKIYFNNCVTSKYSCKGQRNGNMTYCKSFCGQVIDSNDTGCPLPRLCTPTRRSAVCICPNGYKTPDCQPISLNLSNPCSSEIVTCVESVPTSVVVPTDTPISDSLIQQISTLTSLISLNLSNVNASTASLSFLESLTNLETLDVTNSNMPGDISFLSQLTNITTLNMANSGVFGNISSISNLTSLITLVISGTNVFGSLPSLSGLENLQTLIASKIALSGSVSFLTSLKELTTLILDNNPISGDISSFSGLSNLTVLIASNALVSGDISSIIPLKRLTSLDLANNQITGDISVLTTIPNLTTLVVGNTSLKGDITSFLRLTSLITLNASRTDLKGEINSVLSLPKLEVLDLSGCGLNSTSSTSPSISKLQMDFIRDHSIKVDGLGWKTRHMNLQGNDLQLGFESFFKFTSLEELFLGDNNIFGVSSSPPPPLLRTIEIDNNQSPIDISIIHQFAKLSSLQKLSASGCQISGVIPSFVSKQLKYLDVSGNNLSGCVPAFGSPIIEGSLASNKLCGFSTFINIPAVCSALDLSLNCFSTSIASDCNVTQRTSDECVSCLASSTSCAV